MYISVSGRHMDVGDSLKGHIDERLEKTVSKYFDNAIEADVVFSKESHLICTNIVVNEGTGNSIVIKGSGKADDAYASFDLAADRIETQLRRYKRRLKNHHKKAEETLAALEAMKHVISSNNEEDSDDDNPLIIAEKQTSIETLTVSDAVMRMDLANLPALMFINKKDSNINIVYRREDGNISWVESPVKTAA